MKPVELLGALLGNKSGGGGAGAKILKDLLGGAFKGPSQSQPQAGQSQGGSSSGGPDLSDFVRDALNKFKNRSGSAPSAGQAQCDDPSHGASAQGTSAELANAQAVVLIRAMINAAKADGQLDQQEQQNIVKQLGQITPDEVQFLKQEFAAPLNVKEFSWSVPLGLEQQVYGLSLTAINLDQNKEAGYLKELAHGLRLSPDVCNKIHQHYKAPLIFR